MKKLLNAFCPYLVILFVFIFTNTAMSVPYDNDSPTPNGFIDVEAGGTNAGTAPNARTNLGITFDNLPDVDNKGNVGYALRDDGDGTYSFQEITRDITVKDAKLDFNAKGDGVIHPGFGIISTNCSMSSSVNPTYLQCDDPVFKDEQVAARTVIVEGAGSGGSDLWALVSTFTDANNVVLDTAASTTVSGATMRYGREGCSMDSLDATLACTRDIFTDTATDATKPIVVEGAGTTGANLVTTISTVTGGFCAEPYDHETTYPVHTTKAACETATYKWWYGVELTATASTTVDMVAMKYGTDDTTAIQNAVTWASDNNAKIHFPQGVYLYDDEARLDDTAVIEGDGSYITVFSPLPGYTGGWFLTLNDTWGQATPNPFYGEDGGMGVNSLGMTPDGYKQGPILKGFGVHGHRALDHANTHGIRTYDVVDRTFWDDVAAFYLNGTGMSFGLHGGTDYGGPGPRGVLRESRFFNVAVRGCGTDGVHRAFEIGTQTHNATTDVLIEGTNHVTFYSIWLVYNLGESGIYDDSGQSLATRTIRFYDTEIHGLANYEYWQTEWGGTSATVTDDLFVFHGNVRDVMFDGFWINGGSADGSQLKFEPGPVNGEYPQNIVIDGQYRQYCGNNIHIVEGENLKFGGSMDSECEPETSYGLKVDPGAIQAGVVIVDMFGLNKSAGGKPPKVSFAEADYGSLFFRHWLDYDGPGLFKVYNTEGFETGYGIWTISVGSGPTYDSRNGRALGNAYTGSYSVGMFGSYDTGFADYPATLSDTFTSIPGEYYLSFFAKSTSSTLGDVQLSVNVDGTDVVTGMDLTNTTYKHFMFPMTFDASTTVIISNDLYTGTNQEGFYIDDIIVRKVEPDDGDILSYDSSGNGWTAQGSIPASAISEGNSSVEVNDTGTGQVDFTLDSVNLARLIETTGGTYHTFLTAPIAGTRFSIGAADGVANKSPRISFLPDDDASTLDGTALFDYGSDDQDIIGAGSTPYFTIRNSNNGTLTEMITTYMTKGVRFRAQDVANDLDSASSVELPTGTCTFSQIESTGSLVVTCKESGGTVNTYTIAPD